MKRSDEIIELAKALVKAQSSLGGAKADSTNPFYNSSYADLASVWKAIRKPFTDAGIAFIQTTSLRETGVEVETTMIHESGQWYSSNLYMPAEKLTPQEYGKLITYCRRYSLCAMAGVHQEDDDGNSATKPQSLSQQKPLNRPKVDKTTCPHPQFKQSKFNEMEEYCTSCNIKQPKGYIPPPKFDEKEEIPF